MLTASRNNSTHELVKLIDHGGVVQIFVEDMKILTKLYPGVDHQQRAADNSTHELIK